MFSEDFRDRLLMGKYTRWAVDLGEDQLQAILLLLGEFGRRHLDVREKLLNEGEYSRAVAALEGLSKAVKGERVGVREALTLLRNEVDQAIGRAPRDGMTTMIERALKGKDPFTGE